MPLSAEDVKDLADALSKVTATKATSTSTSSAVSVKLPPFWKDEPKLWFAQVESMFSTKGITQDRTKYDYVVSALDNSTALEVKATITKPPQADLYNNLKTVLEEAFDKPQAARDAELLSITDMGDRTPSSHLRYLESLNSDGATLLQALFLSHMSADIRAIVTAQGLTDIKEMAKAADRAVQAKDAGNSHPTAAAVRHRPQRNSRDRNTSRDKPGKNNYICYYHRKFGKQANRCHPECIFNDQPTTTNQIDLQGNETTDRQ